MTAPGYGREDIKVALSFATHLALAIDRSQQTEELRRANERATQAHRRLTDAIEAIPEGFALFDADDVLVLCNNRYRELLYPGMEDLVQPGTAFEDVIRNAVARGLIHDAQDAGEAWVQRRLERHRNPGGSIQIQQRESGIWLQISETSTQEGGIVSIYSDVTELKVREEQLREMDQLKSNFLSSVSHELRTPLTSVRGFARLIAKDFDRRIRPLTATDAKLRRYSDRIAGNLKIIQDESDRLTRLINDVLDLSKIESGAIQWRDAVIEVDDMVRRAYNAASGQFNENPKVKAELRVAAGLPKVRIDRDRLVQVIVNLLNNAAKFTDEGVVQLAARAANDDAVEISVTDTGVGIPVEDVARVFDKFHQVTKTDTLEDKPKGTGLGLAISRQIVEHYGGRIWVESEFGKGSRFAFTLPSCVDASETPAVSQPPLRAPTAVPETSAGGAETKRPLILVVDDEANVRAYLTQLMQSAGYGVVAAAGGREALDLARETKPDLITMDLLMPEMDGATAISKLRAERQLAETPIIVISALSERESAGADVSLGKPIDEEAILSSIGILLNTAQIEAGARPSRQEYLVVTVGETRVETPELSKYRGRITYCPAQQLMERLASGFDGMVVIPATAIQRLDLSQILEMKGVRGIVIVERPAGKISGNGTK